MPRDTKLMFCRWNGVLDKSKKRGDWDDAEDQLLRDALAQDARPNTEALASQLGRPSILVSLAIGIKLLSHCG